MDVAGPTLLDYLTAVGAVATPLLVLVLTGIGWRIRARIKRQAEIADSLREDRIAIYDAILEPFIILFMTDAAWETDRKNKGRSKDQVAMAKMLSLDYRQQAFRLSLIGSDGVVRAYNDLMQHFYHLESKSNDSDKKLAETLSLLGAFLLEIRRSSGNEATELTRWQMLEWWMVEARTLAAEYG